MMKKDELSSAVCGLAELVGRLRGPEGCPWDAKQTAATLKMYLLEESYEVVDAIERGSTDDVCQELGDLLFQIVFLAHLAAEKGEFDLVTVIERITQKMVRRHPHVFGEADLKDAEEVADNWAAIKRKERESATRANSSPPGLPKDLPALLAAHRLSERLSRTGVRSHARDEVGSRVVEGCEQLKRTCRGQDPAKVGEKLGILLFDMADLARRWGLNAEHLLRTANRALGAREAEAESR
jgi:MazG family protein